MSVCYSLPPLGQVCTPGTPLERAQACIALCQRENPEYFRSTILAGRYRACLDECAALQPTEGLEAPNWPADLTAAVGQDLSALEERVRVPFALLATFAVFGYLMLRRLT